MTRRFLIAAPFRKSAVSRHFQALAAELVRRRNAVVYVSPAATPFSPTTGFEHVTWPSRRPVELRDALLLWKLISTHTPHCLVAHFAPVNWMSVVGALRQVPARVAWYHTLTTQIDADNPSIALKRWLLRTRKRLVYCVATHLAVNSNAALRDLQDTYRVPSRKCIVWPNAIADPTPEIDIIPDTERRLAIVCVARFDASKGQEYLLEALTFLPPRHKSISVHFYGNGPLFHELQHKARLLGISHQCVFKGCVSHLEVLSALASAKVSVVPSVNEAFGLVNIESMAVSTPVLASDVDGIAEIIRDGIDGFLVPPRCPAALADRLAQLLDDSELRSRMGREARLRFLSSFEQSVVVKAQADWLERLVGPATRKSIAPAVATL